MVVHSCMQSRSKTKKLEPGSKCLLTSILKKSSWWWTLILVASPWGWHLMEWSLLHMLLKPLLNGICLPYLLLCLGILCECRVLLFKAICNQWLCGNNIISFKGTQWLCSNCQLAWTLPTWRMIPWCQWLLQTPMLHAPMCSILWMVSTHQGYVHLFLPISWIINNCLYRYGFIKVCPDLD